MRLHLDFETYSECDIAACGAERYASDFSTEILCLAYAVEDEQPQVWLPWRDDAPHGLVAALSNPDVTLHAFNAAFERAIIRHKLPALDALIHPRRWRCTATEAYSLSFSGSLDNVLKQACLPVSKDARGTKLIQRFCKPQAANRKVRRWHFGNDPQGFGELVEYCLQDVVAERHLCRWIMRNYNMTPVCWETYFLDADINLRGVPVDVGMLHGAITMRDISVARADQELSLVTGLVNPNSVAQLGTWCRSRGVKFDNMQAATIDRYLRSEGGDPLVRRALELRRQRGLASLAKYDAVERARCGNRLHGTLKYLGASRTGRWSGQIFQPQNLPRGYAYSKKPIEGIAGAINERSEEMLLQLTGESRVLNALSAAIRMVVCTTGSGLAICDLSSIESRVLGWLAQCPRIIDTFRLGLDTYKDFATVIFGVPYDEVTKEQRNYSKPPTLGCFAEGTEVLTRRGWVEIQRVTYMDEVYDGDNFVPCDGAQFMGEKRCVELNGVLVTPDHKILTAYGWATAQSLLIEKTLRQSATRLASGSLSGIQNLDESGGTSLAAAAVRRERSTERMSRAEKVNPAFRARTLGFAPVRLLCKKLLGWMLRLSNDYPAGITPSALERAQIVAPLGMVEGVLSMASAARRILSRTLRRWKGGTTQASTSTGSTTTATTAAETYALFPAQKTNATKAPTAISNTKVASIVLKTFTERLCRSIGARLQCVARFAKGKLQRKLSQGLLAAEVNTYDVVNAGEGERYVIRSTHGDVYIVHNCGYRLGGKVLVEYAAGMGTTMALDDAKRVVQQYRQTFPEVVQLWYWFERATIRAMKKLGEVVENHALKIWCDGEFLWVQLPSGRKLAYFQPQVNSVPSPWGNGMRDEFSFMGQDSRTKQWRRIHAHGGFLTENCLSGDTDVLTPRGWIPMRDITVLDRVWDGDSWVAHAGLVSQGAQRVIDVCGVRVTPDHKVLTDEGWVNAEKAADRRRYSVRLPDCVVLQRLQQREELVFDEVRVRECEGACGFGVDERPCYELWLRQGRESKTPANHARNVEAPRVCGVALDGGEVPQENAPRIQGLRRSWHRGVLRVAGILRGFLAGHGWRLSTGVRLGSGRQLQGVQQGKLPVGITTCELKQQTKHHDGFLRRVLYACLGSVRTVRGEAHNATLPVEDRCAGAFTVLRAGHVEEVFDIINAGHQHRFTVRGDNGEVFIVSNCVQAIARDVLVYGLHRTANAGLDTVLHVHDEIVVDVQHDKDPKQSLEVLRDCMQRPMPWAPDLLLGAEGFTTIHYCKD